MVEYGIRIHKDNHCWKSSELRKSFGKDGGFTRSREVEYLKDPHSNPDPGWNPDCVSDVTFHRAIQLQSRM